MDWARSICNMRSHAILQLRKFRSHYRKYTTSLNWKREEKPFGRSNTESTKGVDIDESKK